MNCGLCHTCGTPIKIVLDGEEWCPKCDAYQRPRVHGWVWGDDWSLCPDKKSRHESGRSKLSTRRILQVKGNVKLNIGLVLTVLSVSALDSQGWAEWIAIVGALIGALLLANGLKEVN